MQNLMDHKMDFSQQLDINEFRSEINVGSFIITKDQIEKFCEVSGERIIAISGSNSIAAPPTFINSLPIQHFTPKMLQKENYNKLLGGQSIECENHIRDGDEITIKSRGIEIYEKTGRSGHMVFAVFECSYFNQTGSLVSKKQDTFIWKNYAKSL